MRRNESACGGLGVEQSYRLTEHSALPGRQRDWLTNEGVKSSRVHEQGSRRDSTGFLGEAPEKVIDAPHVSVRDFHNPAVIKREADRTPGHRGSIANRS